MHVEGRSSCTAAQESPVLRYLLLTTLALIAAPSLVAQEPSDVPRLQFAGGIELWGVRDNMTLTPGLSLQARYAIATLAPRFRVRLGADYVKHDRDFSWGSTAMD